MSVNNEQEGIFSGSTLMLWWDFRRKGFLTLDKEINLIPLLLSAQ